MRRSFENAGRFTVFAIWAVVLIWLLLSGQYAGFLHPRFWPLIAVGAVILEGFLLVRPSRAKEHHCDHASGTTLTTALVVLVPVLFCLAVPNRPLGSNYLAKRASALERPVSYSDTTAQQSPDLLNGVPHLDLLTLHGQATHYAAREIVVDGFVFRPDPRSQAAKLDVPGLVPPPAFHLCRFAMTCCAADALPLTVPVNWPQAEVPGNDTWLRVTGILRLVGSDDALYPMLQASTVEPVDPPSSPYLYMGSLR